MSRLQARPYHWYCLFVAIILEVAGSTVMKLAQNWAFFPHAALAGLVLMWLAIGFVILSFGCGNNRLACRRCLRLLGRALALFWYPFPVFSS